MPFSNVRQFIKSLSVAAIKALSGPVIPWSSGRADALDPSAVTPDGRLPAADIAPAGASPSDADGLRQVFYRMGAFQNFVLLLFFQLQLFVLILIHNISKVLMIRI